MLELLLPSFHPIKESWGGDFSRQFLSFSEHMAVNVGLLLHHCGHHNLTFDCLVSGVFTQNICCLARPGLAIIPITKI